jgi:transcriptional regulator of nitric oxide reductase
MKKSFSVLATSLGLILLNTSATFADGYGHEPVDTSFVLDNKSIFAGIALIVFGLGIALMLEGKYLKNKAKA